MIQLVNTDDSLVGRKVRFINPFTWTCVRDDNGMATFQRSVQDGLGVKQVTATINRTDATFQCVEVKG